MTADSSRNSRSHGTIEEKRFVTSLFKKRGLVAVKKYKKTMKLRSDWGCIDKSKVLEHINKLIGDNTPKEEEVKDDVEYKKIDVTEKNTGLLNKWTSKNRSSN